MSTAVYHEAKPTAKTEREAIKDYNANRKKARVRHVAGGTHSRAGLWWCSCLAFSKEDAKRLSEAMPQHEIHYIHGENDNAAREDTR